jgi:hypothetical protein
MDNALRHMETAQPNQPIPEMANVSFKIEKTLLRAIRVKAADRDEYGVSAYIRDLIKRDLGRE